MEDQNTTQNQNPGSRPTDGVGSSAFKADTSEKKVGASGQIWQFADDMIAGEKPKTDFEFPPNLISLQAVIETLVARGIVSLKELSDSEKKLRSGFLKAGPASTAQTTETVSTVSMVRTTGYIAHHETHLHKFRWLRKKMVKYRWSRRLGTKLFGWHWKRMSKPDE